MTVNAQPATRSATCSIRSARSGACAPNRHTSRDETEESTTALTPKPMRARLPVIAAVATAALPTTRFQMTVAPQRRAARRDAARSRSSTTRA